MTTLRDRRPAPFRFAWLFCFAMGGCAGLQSPDATTEGRPTLTSEELFRVALYQAKRGDFLRAEQYLVSAKAVGYNEDVATYWLVRVCVAAGRYHSALRHAEQHLTTKPDDWRLRLVVASIHEALGELAKARQELQGVLKAEPARALAHYRIGMLYQHSASTAGAAREHLREYLDLEPYGAHSSEVRAVLDRLSSSSAESRTGAETSP